MTLGTDTFSICVFCGARDGASPDYLDAANAFGAKIGEQGMRLVYGAGDVGIMGAVATAAQKSGASTLGVIPTHLVRAEVAKRDLETLIITENMHERKKVMFMNSDAIAVLPGGAGSLDEFFEVLTWSQLGLHDKPIILVNIGGYWDDLIALVNNVVSQGFADESLKGLFSVADTVDAAFSLLASR